MVGASNFHLLGVGAGSLYRLGFLGFALMLTLRAGKEGLIDKGAFKPFCWIVGPQPRPIE